MAGILANPTFVTGAKDDVAAADVYTQSSSTPINKIQETSSSLLDKVKSAGNMLGGKNMLSTIKGALGTATVVKGLLAKGGDPLSRLSGVQGQLGSALRQMPSSMAGINSQILGGVQGLGGVTTTINGMTQKLKYGSDLTKIMEVGKLINATSCDKQVFSVNDMRAQCGAYSGVINGAMSCGIPGAYGAVLKCESNSGVLSRVAGSVLPGSIQMGDIASIGDMVNKLRPGTLKSLNPSLLSDFTRAFPMPTGMTTNRMVDQYQEVKSTFSKIEPDWMSTSRGDYSVINLTRIQDASPDFQQLMGTGVMCSREPVSTEEQLMLMAPKFRPTTVADEIADQFPSTTVFKEQKIDLPPDPRTLVDIQPSEEEVPIAVPNPRVKVLESMMRGHITAWQNAIFDSYNAFMLAKQMKASNDPGANAQLAKANEMLSAARSNFAARYAAFLTEYDGLTTRDRSQFPNIPEGTNEPPYKF